MLTSATGRMVARKSQRLDRFTRLQSPQRGSWKLSEVCWITPGADRSSWVHPTT